MLIKQNPIVSGYNIINDSNGFLENRKKFIFINDQNERKEYDDFTELNSEVLEKISRCQTDQSPSDMPSIEVTINDKHLELTFEHRFKPKCTHQTTVITFYEDIASASDLIYEQFIKQQTNAMNYHIAVFPTEKLLKEISKAEEYFDRKQILRHYNYLNIASCDQIEMMDLVGHTYINMNHRYTRVELNQLDQHCLYSFSHFEEPLALGENHLHRLGISLEFFKTREEYKWDCPNIALCPLQNDPTELQNLVQLQNAHPDIQFIALVDEFIKNEPISQARRQVTDTMYRIQLGKLYIEQTDLDINAARAQAETFSTQIVSQIFDYELTQHSSIDSESNTFQLYGYNFELLQRVQTYQDGWPIYYMHVGEADDMQSVLRFAELTHANNIYAFITIQGISDIDALATISRRLPLLRTLNVAKSAAGHILTPRSRVYHFSETLQIQRAFSLYGAEAVGANPDIAKVQFDLKYGQRLPAQNEEGYNPANPVVVDNVIHYRCRGRRFRQHRTRYTGQRRIVWVQDPSITHTQLASLDIWATQGILVIGYLPQVPVFDDEVRFQQEQIDAFARQDTDELTEDDRRAVMEEKRKQLYATRLHTEIIELVDVECAPDTEGYWYMDSAIPFRARHVTFTDLSQILPVIATAEGEEEPEPDAE